ncbi:MAG: chemotaxis protein CheC, partial [Candidatus Omnitrophica bacterium]|nr:chemotaxis protein CheC [Candidatus Omnitrophota bacterium]
MDVVNQLDEIKSSALKELANIGISHVATAVGEKKKKKVSISLPTMMPFSKEKLLLENQNNNGSIFAAYM